MSWKRIGSILLRLYPYALIIVASLVSNYFLFYQGIPAGDDIRFHLFQITDLIYGFNHGYFSLSTNHVFLGGFAVYNYGFYGPVPHYAAAIIAFIFKGDAEFGYKSVLFLSSVVAGIAFYKLAYRMSKNQHIATIAAAMFIFMPYRIFCAVCRCAFAEVVAICFIPMIFYGAYAIVHDEEYHVGPYISLIIGAAVVIMSHPFTGLICAIFGLLYLVFNIHLLIKKRNGFKIWPSMIVSLVLICCLIGFYVINSMVTKNSGMYRLNDPVIDWTNYEHIADQTGWSWHFSGFLNFIYINQNQNNPGWSEENSSFIIMSLIVFALSIILMIIADSLVRLAPKNKYYRWATNMIGIVFQFLFPARLETLLACIVFYIVFTAVSYLYNPEHYENEKTPLKFNLDFYFLITSIFICLVFIFIPGAWLYVPEIFYQAQFPWRLWGPTMFFIAMLIVLLISYLQKYKGVVVSFASFTALLLTLSQGLIEKRIFYYNDGRVFSDVDVNYVMTESEARYSGAQNEMVPMILMENNYKSEYDNSLYYKVRYGILTWYSNHNPFIYSLEDYQKYNPVFLEGEGNIVITEYNSPNNTFDVKISSKTALIQFPQIYNKTYEIYSQGKSLGEAKNIDGLIAFELPQGEYSVNLNFKNSKGYQIARPFFYVGLVSLIPFTLFGIYYHYKTIDKKKESE